MMGGGSSVLLCPFLTTSHQRVADARVLHRRHVVMENLQVSSCDPFSLARRSLQQGRGVC